MQNHTNSLRNYTELILLKNDLIKSGINDVNLVLLAN